MPSRVTAGPRLNGPATTGTSISIPYGAPLYGPVRYVVPLRKSGLDPDPAVTFAVPMALAGSHLPTFASASLHCATLGMAPTSKKIIQAEAAQQAAMGIQPPAGPPKTKKQQKDGNRPR